jgi:hypothetical protein
MFSIPENVMYPEPIGFWPMNFKTMTKDVSGNENHGIGYGLKLAKGPSGKDNTALQFAGISTSYMKIARTALLDVGATGSFAYTSFINTDKSTACLWEWTDQTYVWSWTYKELVANFPSRVNTQRYYNTESLPLEYNKWLFIGVSFDVVKWKLVLKVNDNVKSFNVSPRNLARTTASWIHLGHRSGSGSIEQKSYYRGRMSCVMLYNVALTPEEMERAMRFCLDYYPTTEGN